MNLVMSETFWLAIPVIGAALWILFKSMSDASYAKAVVDSHAEILHKIEVNVALIKQDIKYLKENVDR